jgi:hypothetical protein
VKKLTLLWLILLIVFATVVFAQQSAIVLIKGDIIDNLCAGTQTPDELAKFVLTHSKECALAPQCAASGYAIFDGASILKFDQASNVKVEVFLKKPDSKLHVVVEAKKEPGNVLNLVSIANQ